LIPPPFPEEARYIWELWVSMQNERDCSFSIHGLKVRDIIGFVNAYGLSLKPFEIDLIRAIDGEFIKANGHS